MTLFVKSILSIFFIWCVEGGMDKKVALIIAHEGYQPIEYCKTRQELENADIAVFTVSDKAGTMVECFGEIEPEAVSMTVKNFLNEDLNNFAGVFLIGGGGALDCLDNEDTYQLMRKVKEAGLYYGAICISPRILYHAGLINDKTITGWNGDGKLQEECPDSNVEDKDVVVDGKLITGRDPHAAEAFGKAVVAALK
jgi:protease I